MANYNHQPFEDWLFSSETLTEEQSRALQEHLISCDHCRCLAAGWHEVEGELKAASDISPAPGFANRWQVRLASQRAQRQKRQAAYFLIFSVGSAFLLLVALSILVWPVFQSPYPFLLALAARITSIYELYNTVPSTIFTLFNTFRQVIPPTLWVGLIVAAGSLFAVWIFALRKLAYERRIVK